MSSALVNTDGFIVAFGLREDFHAKNRFPTADRVNRPIRALRLIIYEDNNRLIWSDILYGEELALARFEGVLTMDAGRVGESYLMQSPFL